ncbi:tail fiber domain-containing protein [Aeromonas veronii]|uniref:tail fiber domain-containing protein n=1 Tax=Aeromonas veronii TaxID=654 RepID=UPI003D2498F7
MKSKSVTPRNQVAAFKIDKAGGRVETLNGFHLVDNGHQVYTTGFNPTPEAIGATRERHWIGKVKLGSWSPICRLYSQQHAAKMFITIGHTRGNFVANATFLVSCGHAGHGTITQLESHGYSQISVRVAMVGDFAEFEILDEDYGTTQEGAIVDYDIKVHGLFGGLDEYNAYTESTGNPMEVVNTEYKTIKIGNDRVYHQGFKPTWKDVGAFPLAGGTLDGGIIANQFAIAESDNGQNWLALEAIDTGLPYISTKIGNVASKAIEFGTSGTTRFMNNVHVNGAVSSEAWGNAFATIGGNIRSNNTSVMSLDGKVYSFVTSPMDAHLCQNSFWDGVEWRKNDINNPSGHLVVRNGTLQFNSSDAGVDNPLQKADFVYHTGHRPTPADIGAADATEVYSKAHIDEKGWMRTADFRGQPRPPSAFNERSISAWFNESGNPTDGWYSGINVRGWADVYASWELLSGSDVPATHEADAYKTALWFRSGHGDTWGEFQKVYTTKHKPTPTEIGAIPTNTANGTPVAAYYTDGSINKTGTKIRLPFNADSLKMVSFTVRVYQNYQSHDVQFSGYLFNQINNWHAPKAIMIAGSSQVAYSMGRDDDGRAYVWVGGSDYRGVGVFNVVGGYNQADWNTGWEISVSDHKPNVVAEGIVYPPYSPTNKPTSEELNVIGLNKKNYLNNTDALGIGFISGATQGAGWIATYHGTDAGTKVVMGSLGGIATIGAHAPDCDEWADLYVNAQDGVAGIPKATIIGNPYAKSSGDANLYRVYHQGFKPNAHEIGAAPDGFGVGGYCATIGTVLGDCNLRRQGGFFHGSTIEGMPADGHTWKYVINACHANAAGYFGYIAMDFDLNHAWLGGQAAGLQKSKKFVFQNDRIVTAGGTGSDYNNGAIEVYGSNGDIKPTIGFHQPSEFAASIGLWSGDDFRFHTQGLAAYAGIMTGNVNANDVYIRSDIRLKKNLVKLDGALEKVSALTAYSYDKKQTFKSTEYDKHEVGLIAQDVEKVLPEAINRVVDSNDEGGEEVLTISNSAVNALLVEAIKELQARIVELERGQGK